MTERRQNLLVGLFAIGGLAILGALVMLFGDVLNIVGAKMYRVTIVFPRGATTALREGTAVTLSGKRVGQTEQIDFRDPLHPGEGIQVVCAIEGRYELPVGTRAEVLTSLMGFGRPALQLKIDDPQVKRTLPRDGKAEIMGVVVPMIDQVLTPETQHNLETSATQIGRLAEALTPVAADLHKIMEVRTIDQVEARELTANLYTAVQRLDAALKNLNAIIGDPHNRENFAAALDNFRKLTADLQGATGDFRSVIGKADQTFGTVQTQVDAAGRKFGELADAGSALLRSSDHAVRLLTEGKGTAGLFLNDNRLYESLVLSSERLGKMIEELRDVLTLMKKGELKYRIF
ncbi:MAG: hypothetical protein U1A27_08410 [Phycisphaerae bacterium]